MKENKIRKGFRSLLAGVLAFVLALTPALSSLPALEVQAADEVVWNYVKAGANNGNSHSYSNANAASKPAAVLLNQSATMPLEGALTTKVRFTNENPAQDARFAVFYTYLDDDHWIYVGYDKSSKWYYQYRNGNKESYPALSELPEPEAGKEYELSVSLAHETIQVKLTEGTNEYVSSKANQELYTLATLINGRGRFGFRAGNGDARTEYMFRDFTYTGQNGAAYDWQFLLPDLGSELSQRTIRTYSVSGNVKNAAGAAVKDATVRVGSKSAATDAQGNYTVTGVEAGTYNVSVSAAGYEAASKEITVTDGNVTVETIVLSEKQAVVYDTYIASSEMKAAIDENFPRVMQYEMIGGSANGKKFTGQETELNKIAINNHAITPQLTDFQKKDDSAVYKMKLVDAANSIDLDMEVTISVKENDLIWEVTEIKKNDGCVKINTINVPNLNLVTISDSQTDTEFMGAVNSGDVNASGDRRITFENGGGFVANNAASYGYGFLSADGLSAGVWSNSEALGDRRVTRNNGADTMSLTTSAWYYEYGDSASSANYDGVPNSAMPCVKVCIAPDLNEDGVVDWQDGAIAYRDIMNNPYGSENVPEMVNYRIVMNLGSGGTNPFMKTADNVKKVYLATDGLPQAIMLKGFGNEGHDSANSEYGGIADRLGGAVDLKKLNTIAHQYNTEVGIHVNDNEAYPEAQTFSEELIMPDQIFNPTAWGWMDKSYVINKIYDWGSRLRYKRFLQLYDQLNDTSLYANKWPGVAGKGADETIADAETIKKVSAENVSNPNNLDYIYLDVWYQDSWETRKIAEEINSLGWRFSTEFGTSGEYDSTWQHWATEGHYGDGTKKGHNSKVMRFIRNHQKDSFVLNYPSFGGEADNPLLGHLGLSGFEGWGSKNDSYNNYIVQTFTENLPAKFLQHYLITKWVDYTGENGDVSPVGSQAKEITLKSQDGKDTVVVTRNAAQRSDNYIERTIRLNGTKILDDVTYLLPWNDWETNEEKLYHWNYDGGTTTWELLDDWKGLQNVVVYELSDQGRGEGKKVNVVNGSITLEATAKTAYVVTKGEEAPKKLKAEFGEGAYVTDPGFNTYAGLGDGDALKADVWSGDIADPSIYVKKVVTGNQYLMMDSPAKDVAVSTELHELILGQDYVAEIYVDNRSDVKAGIAVNSGSKTVSNYSLASLAENFQQPDAHSRRAVPGSRMQVMQVSFVAESDKATLTLSREAGAGMTHFDDIRIVPKAVYNFREDGTFVQDFESVVQGYYPFVLGPAQGVTDPVTHLSEYHAPYTQSGWGSRILDDVISGQWSLKHHGANYGIIYRTIPQNYHFEPGKTYEITFDYQSGSANSYCIVVGDEADANSQYLPYLEKTAAPAWGEKSTTRTYSFTMTGAASGQSWFGLWSNGQQEEGEMGQRDFIMDNLVIKEAEGVKASLTLDKESIVFKGVNGTETIKPTVAGADQAEITYASANDAIATVDANGKVTPAAFGETTITVTANAGGKMLAASVNVSVVRSGEEGCTYANVYANTEETSSESGGRMNTVDGNSSTLWHSNYSTGFAVSESNPAILTYQLNAGQAFNTLRFQQRASGGTNGVIKKYQFVWGTDFDASTHTVTGGSSKTVTVPSNLAKNSAWVDVDISDVNVNTVKYLQIRVLEGMGGFAAMAEFAAFRHEDYTGQEPEAGAVDKQALATLVKDLANGNTFGLSAEEIQKKDAAVAEAMEVLASTAATAEQVAAQIQKLTSVKEALTSGKRTELAELVAEYENADTTGLTVQSVKVFTDALAQAKLALANENASSFEINNILYVLEKAYAGLTKEEGGNIDTEPKKEKAELTDALKAAKGYDSKLYTADSFAKLQDAIKNAEAVLNSGSATQKQVLDALSALKAAVAGLKKAETPQPQPEPDKLKAGDKTVVNKIEYRVIDPVKKTVVAAKGLNKNAKSVTIKASVKIKGVTCTVVQVGPKAFGGFKKLSKVTIGKNVTTIGKQSFQNCKKLKKVIVKGLKLKTIKSGAFKKTAAKMTVKLPKKMKQKQRKALLKKMRKKGKARMK